MDASSLLYLVLFIASLASLTFFVAAEVAFTHVRDDRLERLIQQRAPGARRLARLQRSYESLAMAILVLRSGATVVLALAAYTLVLGLAPSRLVGIPAGILVAVAGAILAQAAGRAAGRPSPEKLALTLVPLGIFVQGTLEPLTRGLIALYQPLVNRWTRRGHATLAANGGGAEGSLVEGSETPPPSSEEAGWERQVIRGALRLESTTVREIMVPRPDIVAIEDDATLEEAVQLVLKEGYSRIPLYQETIDNVRGILYAKDLLAALQERPSAQLVELARPAHLVPETKRLGDLLREFQARRVHIALVVDEYGSLVGLVTNEDLLEELVGEIEDEFTVTGLLVERLGPSEAIVDARTPLKDLNEMFGVDLEAEGFDTLGGLIYHKLGRIPTEGETVAEDGVRLTVLSTAGRRIRRVRVIHGNGAGEAEGEHE